MLHFGQQGAKEVEQLHIVLCDDEKLFLTSVEQKIKAWAQKTGHTSGLMLHTFTSSEDLLDAWEHGMQIDALFLDIQIPGEMNGLAVAKEIHRVNEYIPIVFITSYGEYAEEGYVVNALRYLRKPVSDQAISECMHILWHRWELQQTDSVVLDMPNQILRLPVNSIFYVEVLGHYCIIRTVDDNKEYKLKQSLETIRRKLPSQLFVQCHRSYLVNLMYIRHITSGSITMANGEVIQLGRVYQSQLMKLFRQFYLEGSHEEC